MNFDRENEKGFQRRMLTVEGRQRLCELMATEMLQSSTLSIPVRKLEELVSVAISTPGRLEPSASAMLQDVAADGRMSTLVTLGQNGYVFTHKSFFEFFVARQPATSLDKRDRLLRSAIIPKGALAFVADYTWRDADLLLYALRSLRNGTSSRDEDHTFYRNALAIVLLRPDQSVSFDSVRRIFDHIECLKFTFAQWKFSDCSFSASASEFCNFEDCAFDSLGLIDSSTRDVRLSGCRGVITFRGCSVLRLTLENCEFELDCDSEGGACSTV